MEKLEAIVDEFPFPHMIIENFYNESELDLIWEELNFYTKPGKFLEAKYYGGIVDYTNSKALLLDSLYGEKYRSVSNILNVNRKLFNCGVLDYFANIHQCCILATKSDYDTTKVRYYHDGEYYDPHTDSSMQFLGFSYFYKEPKKFTGGNLIFPQYDYEITCNNNSMIILPGWVEHGVTKVEIDESDYFDGFGRYAITSFFGCKGKTEK